MKFYGDIPTSHRELIRELEDLETWFKDNKDLVPPLSEAKGYVAISHDYYLMEMEEEGQRLLVMADKSYPGYFESAINDHRSKDRDFNQLVENLKETMAIDLMRSYGFPE